MVGTFAILNLTRDSFSDGGRYLLPEPALAHAERLLAAGANVLDVGAESTHPDAEDVPVDEELRRLVPVVIDGPAPERGTPVVTADGAEAGEMRSSQGAQGLALLRLEWLDKGALSAGGARLTPQPPAWMKLPEEKA